MKNTNMLDKNNELTLCIQWCRSHARSVKNNNNEEWILLSLK